MFVFLCVIFVVVVVLLICLVFYFGCVGTPLILALFAAGGSFVLVQCKIDIEKYANCGAIAFITSMTLYAYQEVWEQNDCDKLKM